MRRYALPISGTIIKTTAGFGEFIAVNVPSPSEAISPNTPRILESILLERARQHQLLRANKFPFSCSTPVEPAEAKLPVLMEEVGEVAKEVFELYTVESEAEDPEAKLRTELIQVAAVCVAWLESLQPEPTEAA